MNKIESVDNFDTFEREASEAFGAASSPRELLAHKSVYIGGKSVLGEAIKNLKNLAPRDRELAGRRLNALKERLEKRFAESMEKLRLDEQLRVLGRPVDLTLPPPDSPCRSAHPLSKVVNRTVSIFAKCGYNVAEGPELDTEWYCFDALNIPPHHPARDAQDTFFIPSTSSVHLTRMSNERFIMRTHTSTIQIRAMRATQPPLRIVCPGRVFRRDNVDATHGFNFHQVELLCVDKTATVADLKGLIEFFVRSFFGKKFRMRLRPSFFPFTEPSYEVDIFVHRLGNFADQWLEILGCGIVHRRVFEAVEYDSIWNGFALAFGVERLAMLQYGVDDIRHFYRNDVRFLRQF